MHNYPCGWSPSGGGGGVEAADLPQRINAGAFTSDPANTQSAIVNLPFGTSPGGDYAIYSCIDFPAVWQDSAQYWYIETSPPLSWSSTQIQFRVHFIVQSTISLPGGYRFTLGAKRNQDGATPNGAKVSGNIDYTLSDSNIPRKRLTSVSSAITIPSAVASDGLLLELTRGTNPTSDESDSAYVIGIDLYFV